MGYTKEFKKVLLSEPHAILGKKGITNEFVNHIKDLIKSYKIIKIKVLKSAKNSNIKEIANNLSDVTGTYLLDVRGLTFIISKIPIKKKG